MYILVIILQSLWLMLPAYVANPAAVLFGGSVPIDFGREIKGKRILGDGKTWRGLIGGTAFGMFIGLMQISISLSFNNENFFGFGAFPDFFLLLFLLPFGSLLGDTLGSLIKRRIGKKRGEKCIGLDQYDFIIGTFLLLLIFRQEWFLTHYIYGQYIVGLIAVIIVTPLLHKGVNVIGYKTGKKDVPW